MGEMNQTPNPEINVSGNGKKKKGLGPVKGLLLAILIVFLICVIGLLVRMVVEGDGDYFKPVKSLFGIEEEEEETSSKKKNKKKSDDDEDEDEKETKETKNNKGKTSSKTTARYALLSDDTEDEDVKHYRMALDMEDIMDTVMDEMSELDDDDYGDMNSMMGMAMMILPQVSDMIAGEIYFDIYFEGNDIVQIVVGYEYGELLENLYDYLKEEAEDELEAEGIKSADDLGEMLVEQFDEYLDEDAICKELMSSSDSETAATLSALGIKEKDIKDAIDINNAKGVIELYITGTTKIKGLMSMVLSSEDFLDELKDMEDELKVKVDEDNVIESMLKAINKSDELAAYGLKFVEVN